MVQNLIEAFGPAGATIAISGSLLLFVISDRKQTRSNLKHFAFLHVEQTARLVQYASLPLSILIEDIQALEDFLENSEHSSILTSVLKVMN